MIDFVSSRSGIDPQSAACARLLGSVIATAIRDACEPPSFLERKQKRNRDHRARQAMRFLFERESVFPFYAELIGSNAALIRQALVNSESILRNDSAAPFGDVHRRALKVRLGWWKLDPGHMAKGQDDEADGPAEAAA